METTTCSVNECTRPRRGGDYCNLHRQRLIRTGELGGAAPRRNPGATCSVPDCDNPGRARGMCKSHYRYFMKYGTTTPPQKERKVKTDRPPCRIEGCGAEGRSAYENICSKHYMREYRHGDSNKTAWTVRAANGSVYRRIKAPGHPLAHKDGKAWEHRVVLYDSIGAGVQQCHHCGKELVWMVPDPARNDKRLVYVDHLNSDKSDNRAENLVPSCFRCNTRRGQAERHKQLRAQGFWSGRDTVAQQGRSVSPGEFT